VVVSTSAAIPPLLQGLIDDAAVFPPGNATLPNAIIAHRGHRNSWYAPFVGPLLLPVARFAEINQVIGRRQADSEPAELGFPVGSVGGFVPGVVQVELPWTKSLLAEDWINITKVYAEIDRDDDWLATLDVLAGTPVMPKFRTGGSSAGLFPSVTELATIIVAVRERGLRLKLTAGLHHALRHTDPVTGFTHHGFLNILAACLTPGSEAELLAVLDPAELVATLRPHLAEERKLWAGFGTCSVAEPLEDLLTLGLLEKTA
jgi:hypothetical protein